MYLWADGDSIPRRKGGLVLRRAVASSEDGMRIGLQQRGAVIWPEKPPEYNPPAPAKDKFAGGSVPSTVFFFVDSAEISDNYGRIRLLKEGNAYGIA
jgi:hypothetical protein